MKKILFIVLLLAVAQTLSAQRTITGTVVDVFDNLGIPGATVTVRGANLGTITDIDGRYSLNVPADATHLVFSFMGMVTQTVEIGGLATIDVRMTHGATALEGVVISAYGVTSRASFTGSATRIGSDLLEGRTTPSITTALQGAVPGLVVSSFAATPGSPPDLQIRGLGSANSGTAPLFVVDGVPILSESTSAFADQERALDMLAALAPSDIESITVLRDASATAIFGARASNGVVLITTRQGQAGRTQFSVNVRGGLNSRHGIRGGMQPLNTEQYIDFITRSWQAANPHLTMEEVINELSTTWVNPLAPVEFRRSIIADDINTDWYDEIMRVGRLFDVNASASGGTDRTRFFISGGYQRNEGVVIAQGFERYNARINLTNQATDWLTLGVNVSGALTNMSNTLTGSGAASPIYLATVFLLPNEPVRNPDGTWNEWTNSFAAARMNPVALYTDPEGTRNWQDQYRFTLNPFIRMNLMEDLVFQTRFGYDLMVGDEWSVWSGRFHNQVRPQNGRTVRRLDLRSVQSIVNTINWMPTFGLHNFNIMVGQEAQKWSESMTTSTAFGHSHPLLYVFNATSTGQIITGFNRYATISSVFSNAEYSIWDRYYLSASFRRDGSSRLGANRQWGNFWSVGGRWRISHENFMRPLEHIISTAALRVSYGTTGNQQVMGGFYAARGFYGFGFNYNEQPGMIPLRVANPDLRWESNNKFNIGIDLLLFDRLSLEVDFYDELTTDMIFEVPATLTSGFAVTTRNIGEMRNRGVEAMLTGVLVSQRNLRWTASFNITRNVNRLERLATDEPIFNRNYLIHQEGLDFNTFNMIVFAGVDPTNGRAMFLRGGDGPNRYDIVYHVNQAQRMTLDRRTTPDFFGGFSTTLNAFGFDLSVHTSFSVGGWMHSGDARMLEHFGRNSWRTTSVFAHENSWRPDRTDAILPQIIRQASVDGGATANTMHLMPADIFRIQSITLGYTIPREVAQRMHLTSARIFLSFENPFFFTHRDFRGTTPEIGLEWPDNMWPAPPFRTNAIGLNLNF
ncbi:MAG: SusC/RagA family TonB-linked outer membrane protein [Bacteroidales bacterium]|nr:SusC/RagA family TonB-linked outer membrane protein [Bacteroidales bacterium]